MKHFHSSCTRYDGSSNLQLFVSGLLELLSKWATSKGATSKGATSNGATRKWCYSSLLCSQWLSIGIQ